MSEFELTPGPAMGSPDIEVKVTCPDCGHVRVRAADLRLVVPGSGRSAHYRFRCPQCGADVRREASRVVAAELLARRVPTVSAR
ncbi:MAG: hypothetical protein ACT4PP_10195 [Sporichthyaceae bacterium]